MKYNLLCKTYAINFYITDILQYILNQSTCYYLEDFSCVGSAVNQERSSLAYMNSHSCIIPCHFVCFRINSCVNLNYFLKYL